MQKLVITGPNRLHGEVKVGGSKNAVLPMMAAALLANAPITLYNVPSISDVEVMASILELFNVKVGRQANTLTLDGSSAQAASVDPTLAGKMRASILVLGPAVARFGQAETVPPGGDVIGVRPLDRHLHALSSMGVKVVEAKDRVKLIGKPRAARVIMGDLSVTPTENAILAAVLAPGKTEVRMAAMEPHIVGLCNFLNSLGAKISNIDTHNLQIEGVEILHGGEGTVIPDQLEAGTLAIAAAASQGEVKIDGFVQDDHDALLNVFIEMNVNFEILSPTEIRICPSDKLKSTKVKTQPYPNLPTDLQAPLAVLMTQATGQSEIFETMYEGRLSYLYELQRMGADISLKDTHVGLIKGPTKLHGTDLVSFDIRAGATILVAALIAEGKTTIDRVEHIDRGYEYLDKRFGSLGAKIERIDNGQ
ncbi:UDP-N-acetylglucosamine 1-carboxyvinyltransferase [Candidatus Saccharibacteria bacterium]|nr:UDP-N-acetylglucosamine 1-carboxyvinyltransferase [Candidatus Saccharibacteria bacterium]